MIRQDSIKVIISCLSNCAGCHQSGCGCKAVSLRQHLERITLVAECGELVGQGFLGTGGAVLHHSAQTVLCFKNRFVVSFSFFSKYQQQLKTTCLWCRTGPVCFTIDVSRCSASLQSRPAGQSSDFTQFSSSLRHAAFRTIRRQFRHNLKYPINIFRCASISRSGSVTHSVTL